MFEYIIGKITALNPAEASVETASGIGFSVQITVPDYELLEKCLSEGTTVKLLLHEAIREDAWTLYGFVNATDRELFRKLIGVSGVGASMARMLLSSLPSGELAHAIVEGNSKKLKGVKGVGAKTAERIIVDLHDKIKADDFALVIDSEKAESMPENFEDALAALVMLGYSAPQSRKVLKKLFAENPGLKTEAAVRKAFPLL